MDPTCGALKTISCSRLDSWIRHAGEVLDPDWWTRIVDPTRSPKLFTRLGDPTCAVLKTSSGSALDSWIDNAWEVFDLDLWTQIVAPDSFTRLIRLTRGPDFCSLKNKQLLRIGLVDQPRVGGVRLVEL